MFRTHRPPTLSINELNHILSESLDLENIPETVIHHDPLLLTTPEKSKSSTFHRFFSRSSPHLPIFSQSPPEQVHEPITPSPRKMTFTWRLPRLSPHRPRKTEDHAAKGSVCDAGVPVNPSNRSRSSSAASAAQAPQRTLTSMSSSSSLGSIIPASERIFNQVTEEGVHTQSENVASTSLPSHSLSPFPIVHHQLSPTQMIHFPSAPRSPLQFLFGSKSSLCLVPRAITREPTNSDVVGRGPGTSASEYMDSESSDDNSTPRATEFAVSSHRHSGSTIQAKQRRRPSALTLILPQEHSSLCLQPAIGATPHVPSDTESSMSASAWSISSPTMSIPTSSQLSPTSPASYNPLASPVSSMKSPTSTSSFPWSRARSGSRSMQTPPLPGPPPSCPLPPPPTLSAQDSHTPSNPPKPLPTVSPSPSKRSRTPVRSSSPTGIVTCIPSSSPGSLRLPSRLSWGATGRIVVPASSSLPSPPSSPSKAGRKKEITSPKDQKDGMSDATSLTLGKRTSVGVLEAASDLEARVRRTKSILVLGSRRSKGALGCPDSPPKRVQIHAEANPDATQSSPPKKPRRQSSASTMPFLAVPRERRRSAPLLGSGVTSAGVPIPPAGADWTLSLPFCIDVPGSGIILPTPPSEDGALHEADEALQVAQGDDWTLSLGADRQTANAEEAVASDNMQAKDGAEEQFSVITQLPTPSATPEPDDHILQSAPPFGFTPFPTYSRPASPASLGPHGGGLDLDGGYGKRGSGWDVCGWFGPSDTEEPAKEDARPISMFQSEASWIRRSTDTDAPRRSDVGCARRSHEKWLCHSSEDSTTTAGTVDTVFYSARTSILVV
ncbi:hypothetical protein K503DRAFT_867166 [Rhizopogon vinicolor AM-OR11-026]|uniref:Uncharacterized protein n=1 Tax=Rhizopogon vinicolor AM-OR11-026 TaxID=1314800 RepID=A0A1B7MWN8_9AGAM|nr:hypothetical protein K503DRAFT_867166 [Rhizopogon vinicolor AM-OR11-026]